MKIQIASDLHLEFDDYNRVRMVPATDRDLLVLAGDINMGRRAKSFIQEQLELSPVVYVPGNHEYYEEIKRSELDDWWREMADTELPGLHYLQMDDVMIGGIRIRGATWYSDFWGGEGHYASTHVTDFQPPYNQPGDWCVEDHKRAHEVTTSWLATDTSADVIVTHFPPSKRANLYDTPLRISFTDSYYFNDQDDLVRELQPRLWISGHAHVPYDFMIDDCRCIGNPCGYPGQVEKHYRKSKVVELGSRSGDVTEIECEERR